MILSILVFLGRPVTACIIIVNGNLEISFNTF